MGIILATLKASGYVPLLKERLKIFDKIGQIEFKTLHKNCDLISSLLHFLYSIDNMTLLTSASVFGVKSCELKLGGVKIVKV